MAKLTLQQLRQIVREHTNWEAEGWQPPERVLDVKLKNGSGEEPVLDAKLAGKTLSYEGREATVVLDFDEQGYLVGLEFV